MCVCMCMRERKREEKKNLFTTLGYIILSCVLHNMLSSSVYGCLCVLSVYVHNVDKCVCMCVCCVRVL